MAVQRRRPDRSLAVAHTLPTRHEDPSEDAEPLLGPSPRRRRRPILAVIVTAAVTAGAGWAALEAVGGSDRPTPTAARSAMAPAPWSLSDDDAAEVARTIPTTTTAPPSQHVLRAVYVVPDGVAAVPGRVEGIRHEVGVLAAWFAKQTGGGRPRFATDADGQISVAAVTVRPDDLRVSSIAPQVDTLIGAAQRDGLLMFVEAPAPEGADQCGVALHDWAAAVIWLGVCEGPGTKTAFSEGATAIAAHEVAHVLGAVYECAANDDALGHVTDDPNDLMSAESWPNPRAIRLDAGGDDYLAPDGDCPSITESHLWDSQAAGGATPAG